MRTIASNLSIGHNIPIFLAIERFKQTADTIESLSAKLEAANMECQKIESELFKKVYS